MACHINNFDHDHTLSGYRMMKHWQKSFVGSLLKQGGEGNRDKKLVTT